MFILDKLASAVLRLDNLLTLCLLVGVILHLLSRGRRGKLPVGLSCLGFALLGVTPIGAAMMSAFGRAISAPGQAARSDRRDPAAGRRVQPGLFIVPRRDRFYSITGPIRGAVALARGHPEAKLVLVGGGRFPFGYSETSTTLGFVLNEGIAPGRIVLEGKLRTPP